MNIKKYVYRYFKGRPRKDYHYALLDQAISSLIDSKIQNLEEKLRDSLKECAEKRSKKIDKEREIKEECEKLFLLPVGVKVHFRNPQDRIQIYGNEEEYKRVHQEFLALKNDLSTLRHRDRYKKSVIQSLSKVNPPSLKNLTLFVTHNILLSTEKDEEQEFFDHQQEELYKELDVLLLYLERRGKLVGYTLLRTYKEEAIKGEGLPGYLNTILKTLQHDISSDVGPWFDPTARKLFDKDCSLLFTETRKLFYDYFKGKETMLG